MSDENFRKLLEQLQEELERTKSEDEKGGALLHNLNTDINNRLKSSGEGQAPDDESTLEQLKDAVEHFEVTHPRLTMMLSEMMTVLSNAGI